MDNSGMATCKHCGSQFRLFSISNRDMSGLCRGWKTKHEFKCKQRTPLQRRTWAKPYLIEGADRAITINLEHPGFL